MIYVINPELRGSREKDWYFFYLPSTSRYYDYKRMRKKKFHKKKRAARIYDVVYLKKKKVSTEKAPLLMD